MVIFLISATCVLDCKQAQWQYNGVEIKHHVSRTIIHHPQKKYQKWAWVRKKHQAIGDVLLFYQHQGHVGIIHGNLVGYDMACIARYVTCLLVNTLSNCSYIFHNPRLGRCKQASPQTRAPLCGLPSLRMANNSRKMM